MDVLAAMGVFVRVVDLKSFSLAAAELGISSSSVSKQVSHLEQHVGARLLQRTTRRLSVTEVGARAAEPCSRDLPARRNDSHGQLRFQPPRRHRQPHRQ